MAKSPRDLAAFQEGPTRPGQELLLAGGWEPGSVVYMVRARSRLVPGRPRLVDVTMSGLIKYIVESRKYIVTFSDQASVIGGIICAFALGPLSIYLLVDIVLNGYRPSNVELLEASTAAFFAAIGYLFIFIEFKKTFRK
jgi:hypothetical protein